MQTRCLFMFICKSFRSYKSSIPWSLVEPPVGVVTHFQLFRHCLATVYRAVGTIYIELKDEWDTVFNQLNSASTWTTQFLICLDPSTICSVIFVIKRIRQLFKNINVFISKVVRHLMKPMSNQSLIRTK